MNKKEFMKPSMTVVNIQAADQLLSASNDLGFHDEVSGNNSYAREGKWSDDDSHTSKNIWSDEW